MKSDLDRLVAKLESETLLAAPLVDSSEIDVALNDRDDPKCEADWLRASQQLSQVEIDAATADVVKRIRELAFKIAFRHSENPDFAGYVSNDFDLIARALIVEWNDPWLSGVLADYVAGSFPRGSVERQERGLTEQI